MLKAKGLEGGKPLKQKKPIIEVNYCYDTTSRKAGRLYEKLDRQEFQIIPDSGSDVTVCISILIKKLKLTVELVKQTKI